MTFTQDELAAILYCMEQMETAYDTEEEGYKNYLSALVKLKENYEWLTVNAKNLYMISPAIT